MTLEEIRELLKFVVETGVAELEVQRGQDKVRIRRTWANEQPQAYNQYHAPLQAAAPEPSQANQSVPGEAPVGLKTSLTTESADPATDPSIHVVRSPIVGTFYEAPSPGADPFVSEGDTVEPGQVLCIIESMKLMNEVESDVAGVIVKKLVENGQPVEYGQSLFLIRKTS